MEQFGYPDFLLSSANELIDAQYADRPHLRPILEAIIEAAGRAWRDHRPGAQRTCLAGRTTPNVRARASNDEEPR
jgi:hypothetical protein